MKAAHFAKIGFGFLGFFFNYYNLYVTYFANLEPRCSQFFTVCFTKRKG